MQTLLINKILSRADLTAELRLKETVEVNKAFASSPLVISFKSSSRSCQPENFHGTASDHGVTASSWLYGVQLYFQAEYIPDPVVKVVTYLHADARRWWRHSGSQSMPASPTFADFSAAFLARYVILIVLLESTLSLPFLRPWLYSIPVTAIFLTFTVKPDQFTNASIFSACLARSDAVIAAANISSAYADVLVV